MKISYRKNSGNSFAVIEDPALGADSLFFGKMISGNKIPHLLPLQTEKIDGHTLFLYDITGKRSFAKTFESRKMSMDVFSSFINSLRELSECFTELLLDTDRIILKEDAIFLDHASNNFWFCADPGDGSKASDQVRNFFDGLLSVIDYDDQRLVALVFSLSRLSRNDSFSLQDLLSVDLNMYQEPSPKGAGEEPPSVSISERPLFTVQPQGNTSFMEKAKIFFRGKSFSEIYDAVNSGRILRLIKETEPPVVQMPLVPVADRPAVPALREETVYAQKSSGINDTASLNITDLPFHRLNGLDGSSGIVILLDHFPFTIGKDGDNVDFHLEKPPISRMHCRIYENDDGTFDIEDLNSTNGSVVNGTVLDPYSREPLLPGDTVTLADLKFIFI